MSRRRLLACLALAPVLWSTARGLLAQTRSEAPRQRRIALVIGNARYRDSPLNNPEHDARLIARTLRSLDFEVGEHLNLNARDFKRVLREFAQRMDDDQVASVFYYAGHGVQIGGRNFLLPVDIALRDEGEVRDEAIDVQETLLGHIDRVRPRARIFIIDACRNDPFSGRARGSRSRANGLAEMAAPGALIAFSAAPGRVAEDGPVGGNSIYTQHLATELRTPGIEVEEMMKLVRIKVLRDTAQRQIPWVNTSMVVNFMFNPGGAAGPRRNLQLLVQAQRSLNTDARNASASLAMRVYVLRDASGFEAASFDSLYDNDEVTLGSSVLARQVLHLRPGEARELALELSGDARAVAVFGAFREIEQSQWRAVLPLPAGAAVPRARVDANARQLLLGWAK